MIYAMISFGQNLKSVRDKKAISQAELAKKVGVHVTHFSRYERDLSLPTLEVVKKIAESLQISLDELVYGNEETQINKNLGDRELLQLFTKVQQFSDKQKEVVKDLLSAYVLKTDLQKELR